MLLWETLNRHCVPLGPLLHKLRPPQTLCSQLVLQKHPETSRSASGLKNREKAEWALPWRGKKAKPRVAQGWLSMSERRGKMADRSSKSWKKDQASN